tara:strand:- start:207 stop:749 length:543 start_codon:yes stop_codon:yes gene_type:complete
MRVERTKIEDLLLIQHDLFEDDRGYFQDLYDENKLKDLLDVDIRFVKDSMSFSKKSVLRGMHFQMKYPQGKLIYVASGAILDVVVDLRKESKSFGSHFSVTLNDQENKQLYIPPGFAHGFYVLSDIAKVCYKLTEKYYPEDQYTLAWNDPDVNIEWPDSKPILSNKDCKGLSLKDIQQLQ